MKRITKKAALAIAVVMGISSMPPTPFYAKAESTVIEIRTTEDLRDLARECTFESYSEGKIVRLEADLDLLGETFSPIPVFCGTFEGNGHTISGMSILQSGSNLGLFRYLEEEAVVQNLKVQGELMPEGSRKRIGGIAGTNKGTIRNCSFSGTGEALENLGGIAGINEETGVIENCLNQADLTGNRRIGGIAGENVGSILDSSNEGTINAGSEGIDEENGSKNSISVDSMDRENLMTTIVMEKVNDVGGIAGLSTGNIQNCKNSASIGYEHTGYNIGGIVGRQSGLLVLCENSGIIAGRKDVGGIAGQLEPLLMIQYNQDALEQAGKQVDRIADTTDAMTQSIRGTTDASIDNLDRVDEIVKSIRDITRDKKDDRRMKRDDYDEKAKKQLDQIDEILANTELDLGSRSADRAENRIRANIRRARELLNQLKGGNGGVGDGDVLPDDYIPNEDDEILGELQYLYERLEELQDCAGDIVEDTQLMVEERMDGVVDGIRDFEDDLDSLRVASKEFLDLTRNYKDRLVEDMDGLDADLTGQLDQLYDELDVLSDNLKSGKDQLRAEKDQLDEQLEGMHDIISDGVDRVRTERDKIGDDSESLFEDISETANELGDGMIIDCSNQGNVFSDFQGAGVVGTIGIEVDLDPEKDIETYGDESLYRNRYAQAVVRGCRNEGDILVQQDYAGGIAGTARIGVLASNQNYGDICTKDGNYAGGIAGVSQSLIQNSYSMCEVKGNDYTGGIAGLGKNMQNNYGMTDIVAAEGEWKGSIAGDREKDGIVSENFYVDNGLGAIDGITFLGEAEGISYESLLQKDGLPPEFHTLTVTFLTEDQTVKQIVCQYGQSLNSEEIPDVPKREGFFESWEDIDLSNIRKNYKIFAVYQPWTTTIASSQEPKPQMLAEATFYPDTRLQVQEIDKDKLADLDLTIPSGYQGIKFCSYEILNTENNILPNMVKLHVLAEGADTVWSLNAGKIDRLDCVKDGDYLIFESGISGEILLMKSKPKWGLLIIAGVGMVVAILVVKKKRGWQTAKAIQ